MAQPTEIRPVRRDDFAAWGAQFFRQFSKFSLTSFAKRGAAKFTNFCNDFLDLLVGGGRHCCILREISFLFDTEHT